MATSTQNKPVFTTRHRRLDVAVWKNEGQKGTFHNITLKKSFKEGDEWKETQASFGEEDAFGAAKLLDWADDMVQEALQRQEQAVSKDKPLTSKKRDMLEAAVFQPKVGSFRVSLRRSYKDGDEWKSVTVWLLVSDCLAAARLLERAFDAIDSHVSASSSSFVAAADNMFGGQAGPADEDIPF